MAMAMCVCNKAELINVRKLTLTDSGSVADIRVREDTWGAGKVTPY